MDSPTPKKRKKTAQHSGEVAKHGIEQEKASAETEPPLS